MLMLSQQIKQEDKWTTACYFGFDFVFETRGGRQEAVAPWQLSHVLLLMVSVVSVRRCFSCRCQRFPGEAEFIDTVCLLSTYSQFMCYILHKVNLARGKLILQFFKANAQ